MRARPFFRSLAIAIVAAGALTAAGCERQYLGATPNLLGHEDPERVFAACSTGCQDPSMEGLDATDRGTEGTRDGRTYGYARAGRLAFGTPTVALHPAP